MGQQYTTNMSWQTYVDKNLVGTGHCAQAAILGHNGAVWAKSAGFDVTPAEGAALVKGFASPSPLFASGIHLNKVRSFALVLIPKPSVERKEPLDATLSRPRREFWSPSTETRLNLDNALLSLRNWETTSRNKDTKKFNMYYINENIVL